MLEQIGFFESIEMTPTQFEQEVTRCLKASGMSLVSSSVKHNVKLPGSDGVYQIDVLAEFEALGAKFRVLIECKHQKHPIKREIVQILHDKIRSTGSQKGMIFATTGFQKGALEYAKDHGIALVQVTSGKYTYEARSKDGLFVVPPWENTPKYCMYLLKSADNGNTIIRSLVDDSGIILGDLLDLN
jgi:restriction system protein